MTRENEMTIRKDRQGMLAFFEEMCNPNTDEETFKSALSNCLDIMRKQRALNSRVN